MQTKLRVIHFEKQILWHPHFDTNIRVKKSRGFEPTTEIQLRGKGRGDLSLFQAPVQFVKRSSTLTHVWQTLRSRKKKKLIPKPPSLFLYTATIAPFSSSLRFIHRTSVTAQYKPLIWNISNEKRKTNKKTTTTKKKRRRTKIFPWPWTSAESESLGMGPTLETRRIVNKSSQYRTTTLHFRHMWLWFSILLITQLYCTEKFLHCQFITRTSFIGRRKF